jgi:hypothetical protein
VFPCGPGHFAPDVAIETASALSANKVIRRTISFPLEWAA